MNGGRTARRLLLAVVVGLIGAVLMVRLGSAKKYRGRPLQHWVCPNATDRWGPDTMRHYHTNAVASFREAGGDGVKLLLDELGCERNRWNAWRFAQAGKWQPRSRDLANWLYFRWYSGSPADRVQGASAILDQLPLNDRHLPYLARHFMNARGKDAPSAVLPADFSAWVRLGGLANALARSGTNGAQVIAEALPQTTNTDQVVLLVSALQRAHTNAATAVPALLALASRTKDKDRDRVLKGRPVPSGVHPIYWSNYYHLVLQALMAIRGDASVPFLFQAATNGHVGALSALGEYGPEVKHLLPQLLPLTTNSDPQVSFQADIAVRKIRGH